MSEYDEIIEEESEEESEEEHLAVSKMPESQRRQMNKSRKKNKGKNQSGKRKRRRKDKKVRRKNRVKLKKYRKRRSRKPWAKRKRAAERVADRWLNADMFYEKRPPDEDEIYYPSGTNYSPSGGNGYYKFDPSNKERKPSEVQNTDGEQPDVGNTSRVVPNGQFVKASVYKKDNPLMLRQISLMDSLNELREILEQIDNIRKGKRLKVHTLSKEEQQHFEKILDLLKSGGKSARQALVLANSLGLLGNVQQMILLYAEDTQDDLLEVFEEIEEWNRAEDKRLDQLFKNSYSKKDT